MGGKREEVGGRILTHVVEGESPSLGSGSISADSINLAISARDQARLCEDAPADEAVECLRLELPLFLMPKSGC